MVITLHPTVITCNYGNSNLRSNITIKELPFGVGRSPRMTFSTYCKKIAQLS